MKKFISVITAGIIFVESTAVYDSHGNMLEGSRITYTMLMREAQRLGADDIINVRIDKIQRINRITTQETRVRQSSQPDGSFRQEEITVPVVSIRIETEYKASALAIRYLPVR